MPVDVYRDNRELERSALRQHAGFDREADLRIARFSENVDLAKVHPGSRYHSVCLIERGGMIRIDRPKPKYPPGSITVEPTWFEGTFTNDEQTDWISVYVREERLTEIGAYLSEGAPPPTLKRVGGEADPILADLLRACASSLLGEGPVTQLELDGWAQVIGAHLLQTHVERPLGRIRGKSALSPRALKIALAAIEEDLSGDLSIAALARILDMGTTRFSEDFRAATGKPLHQYVIERRIDRARNLIESTDMTLADIAYAVGFSSQSHLTSVFRTRLGITPGRYRVQHRN